MADQLKKKTTSGTGKGIVYGAYPTKFTADSGIVYEKVVVSYADEADLVREGLVGIPCRLMKVEKDVFYDTFADLKECIGKRIYLGQDSYQNVNMITVLQAKK